MLLFWAPHGGLLFSGFCCEASVACATNTECASQLRPGSECIAGFCTNPFQRGCLRNYLGMDAFPQPRTCNSDDSSNDNNNSNGPSSILLEATTSTDGNSSSLPFRDEEPMCTPSAFGYSEIRILSMNWESAMFTAWILQIVLSELFQVPATIESSGPGRMLNFYDPEMSFSYGAMGYDWDAMKRANVAPVRGGTCPKSWRTEPTTTNDDANVTEWEYTSCAHVIPEVWSGQTSTVADLTSQQIVEPPEGTGAVGKLSWFLPKFVARSDPSLTHWLGLTGESNRRKVAETFKVPTTFGQYCTEIVPHNCTEETLFASRPPADEAEAGKYYIAGVYQGFFRWTPQNDCDLNPTTCRGHIADVPCEWTTFVSSQAYYLNISVASGGSVGPNNAYSYGELLDIWAAANATRSPVLMYWWYPDPTYQFYLGSSSEMQIVQLPPPQQRCIENRVTPEARCSEDGNLTERLGNPLGACDAEPHSLLKLLITNVFRNVHGEFSGFDDGEKMDYQSSLAESDDSVDGTGVETMTSKSDNWNEAYDSPAYDAIAALSITELQLGQIIAAWNARGFDTWNYDPREAVCEWVVNNVETLKTWIPRTYPRVVQDKAHDDGNEILYGIALGMGCLVTLMVIGISVLTFWWRKRPVLLIAQVGFLYFLLVGLLLVSVGSILVALQPTDTTCMMQNWFILLGYSMELVPLIVKIAAIHRMTQAAKRMKRIRLDQRQLYGTVLFVCFMVTIVLVIWTVVDPSKELDEVTLHPDRTTEKGETVVTITHYCASAGNDSIWRYLSLAVQLILLLCASVLAYQSRNVRQDLNESQTLGLMIYSHFVFVVLRLITFFLEGIVNRGTLTGLKSLILSLDVLVALNIYFTPKMYGLFIYDDEYFKAVMSIQRRSMMGSQGSVSNIRQSVAMSRGSLNSSYSMPGVAFMDHDVESDRNSVEAGGSGSARKRRSAKWSSSFRGSVSEDDDDKSYNLEGIPESKDENNSANPVGKRLDEHDSEKGESKDDVAAGRKSIGDGARPSINGGIKAALPMSSEADSSLHRESSCISISSDEDEKTNSEEKDAAIDKAHRDYGRKLEHEAHVIISALHNLQDEALPGDGEQKSPTASPSGSGFLQANANPRSRESINGMKLKFLEEHGIDTSSHPMLKSSTAGQKHRYNGSDGLTAVSRAAGDVGVDDNSSSKDSLQDVVLELFGDDQDVTDGHYFF